MPEPNAREQDLALWVMGQDEASRDRFARILAHYREEILAPFAEMLVDYQALRDDRVTLHLTRLIQTARGEP